MQRMSWRDKWSRILMCKDCTGGKLKIKELNFQME
jgi:hypothetical protein